MPDLHPFTLDRIDRAIELVHERLLRSTGALGRAGVAYAVAGGSAVKAWVTRTDESAVRQTPDVDIVVAASEFESARAAFETAGFLYRPAQRGDLFVEDERAPDRHAMRDYRSGVKLREDDPVPVPDVTESEPGREFRILSLAALIRMELTLDRVVNKVHVRDLIDVGLVDASWVQGLPSPVE